MQLVLSNNLYKFLDIVLMKYRHLPSRIARRKLEIETFHATDVNIGGGKNNQVTKRTEWLVERFDSDVKLKGLECQQRAVEATIEVLDETMTRVFELRWIDGYTPEEIAELTNSTVKNTQKRLERIMEIFADYWGWT
ncbi:RNA polymerase sigma factor [Streptococcus suis]